MDKSRIEWTDATWNPVVGCTRVSAGCDNCYAVPMTHRLASMAETGDRGVGRKAMYHGLTVLNGRGDRHFNGVVRTVPEALTVPLRWKRPRRIFVNSMSDLFHKSVPFGFVDRVFAVMALCPQHQFQVLTKRPERMAEYFRRTVTFDGVTLTTIESIVLSAIQTCNDVLGRGFGDERHAYENSIPWPFPNVWLGTSCEDQDAADERIPHLLRCPTAVRFLSCEPLLGPIELAAFLGHIHEDTLGVENQKHAPGPFHDPWHDPLLHWVIVGGESGPNARPCEVSWIESLRWQCREAGVPVFIKQMGSNVGMTGPTGPEVREWGDTEIVRFADGVRLILKDKKGGDPDEWPERFRVRMWPAQRKGDSHA